MKCRHNKKNLCSYSHVPFASDDVRNDALEKKIEVLENQVMEIKKKDGMCKEASKKVEAFKNIIEQKENRIVAFEEKIKHFKNKFSDINTLEAKVNDVENLLQKQTK